jgi:predicted dehydrogenase
VTGGGLYYHKDGREVPDTVHACIDYEDGPTVSLLASLATGQNCPMIARGQKAAMIVRGLAEIQIIPESLPNAPAVSQPTVIKGKDGNNLFDHWRDFLNCVRTRNKPISNEVLGYRVMVALSMAVKSYRSGKAMGFDSQQGTIKEL